jgi:hypothetical protein
MCGLQKSFEDIVRWRWSLSLGKVVCVAPLAISDDVCRQSLHVHCVRLPASRLHSGVSSGVQVVYYLGTDSLSALVFLAVASYQRKMEFVRLFILKSQVEVCRVDYIIFSNGTILAKRCDVLICMKLLDQVLPPGNLQKKICLPSTVEG